MFLYFVLVNLLYLAMEIFRRGRGFAPYGLQMLLFAAFPAWLLFAGTPGLQDLLLSIALMTLVIIIPYSMAWAERRALFASSPRNFSRLSLLKFLLIPTASNFFVYQGSRVFLKTGAEGLEAWIDHRAQQLFSWGSLTPLRILACQARLKKWWNDSPAVASDPPAERALKFLLSSCRTFQPGPEEFLMILRCHLELQHFPEALAAFETICLMTMNRSGTGRSLQEIRACVPVGLMLAFAWAGKHQALRELAGNSRFGLSSLPEEQIRFWLALAAALDGRHEMVEEEMRKVRKSLSGVDGAFALRDLEERISAALEGRIQAMNSQDAGRFAAAAAMGLGFHEEAEVSISSEPLADSRKQDDGSWISAYRGAPVSLAILLLCSALFLICNVILGHGVPDSQELEQLIRFGANAGFMVSAGQWHRLLTCVFLHGNLTHLLMNMFFLHAFGPIVEKSIGSMAYLGLFTLSGLAGSGLNYAMGGGVSVGASGALMGLLGFMVLARLRFQWLLKGPSNQSGDGPTAMRPLLFSLIAIILIGSLEKNIDNYGHLGGLAGGVTVTLLMAGLASLARGDIKASRLPVALRGILGCLGAGLLLTSLILGFRAYEEGGYPQVVPAMTRQLVAPGISAELPLNWDMVDRDKGLWTDHIRSFFRVVDELLVLPGDGETFWKELVSQNLAYLSRKTSMKLLSWKSEEIQVQQRLMRRVTWIIESPEQGVMCSVDYLITGSEPAPLIHFQIFGETVEPSYSRLFDRIALGLEVKGENN